MRNNQSFYPASELGLKRSVDALMSEWKNHFDAVSDKAMASRYEVGNLSELFVPDGFYPYYTQQRHKILFIGRECLELAGGDYIEILHDAIKRDKAVGLTNSGKPKSLNSARFHAMMLYVAYAIQTGHHSYGSLPWAKELADSFAVEGGFSYAFMNLSKLSNESGQWQKDEALMRSFLDDEKFKDFFARELEILDPDIIVAMNLVGAYGTHLGDLTRLASFGSAGQSVLYTLETPLGSYKLVDTYHYSAQGKKSEEDLFDPTLQACLTALGCPK